MKVLELLHEPTAWTQEASARASDFEEVGVFDGMATCWCISGALDKCYPGFDRSKEAQKVMDAITTLFPDNCDTIASFNDKATHEQVIEVLTLAGV